MASLGGKSVPPEKRTFSQDRELARRAGRKGGQSVPAEKRTFSRDPIQAGLAGRKGGKNVPPETRSFSTNPALASAAGRKARAAGSRTEAHPVESVGTGEMGTGQPEVERARSTG